MTREKAVTDRILKATADAGYDAARMRSTLATLSSRHLVPTRLLSGIEPAIVATARAGHDPRHMVDAIHSFMSGGPPATGSHRAVNLVAPLLERIARNGDDPAPAARFLLPCLRAADIPESDVIYLYEHLPVSPQYDSALLAESAVYAASDSKIPIRDVLAIQNMFIEKGHFPTAGSVVEFHRRFHKK